jgi:hypothetical protein
MSAIIPIVLNPDLITAPHSLQVRSARSSRSTAMMIPQHSKSPKAECGTRIGYSPGSFTDLLSRPAVPSFLAFPCPLALLLRPLAVEICGGIAEQEPAPEGTQFLHGFGVVWKSIYRIFGSAATGITCDPAIASPWRGCKRRSLVRNFVPQSRQTYLRLPVRRTISRSRCWAFLIFNLPERHTGHIKKEFITF